MRSLTLSFLLLAACDGTIGDGGGGINIESPSVGEAVLEGGRLRARVWRLTPQQFEDEARRLLGELPDAGQYPLGESEAGLTNIAVRAPVDRPVAQRIAQITDDYGTWVTENAEAVSGCTDRDCAVAYLHGLLESAYRRPATDVEQDAIATLFDSILADHDLPYALGRSVQAVLISPSMIYRHELGAPFDGRIEGEAPEGGSISVLGDYEIASLLSFSLTDRSPDATLLAAAAAGELRDPQVRAREARRLMDDSAGVWQRFFWEWLDMYRFESSATALDVSDELQAAMLEEYNAFIEDTVVLQRGSLDDVFASPRSFASPELAAIYEVDHPGSGLQPITFNPAERAGMLTHAAWLVAHASREEEFVVRRGMGLYLHALCRNLTPPDGLDVNAAQEGLTPEDATVREKVEARSNDRVCGACHTVPDPIGLAFERFDAIGRRRDVYPDGHVVDSNAQVPGIGSVTSAADLGAALAESGEVQNCFVRRVAHSMLGADLGPQSVWVNDVTDAFVSADRSIEGLVVALVSHPGFVERAVIAEGDE
ncbi:MAG: DUF1592 domain-containing protein [Myxococcota bacterium]